MKTEDIEQSGQAPDLMPLNVIRVETALSRFPVHRLAKQGTVAIEIREKSPSGEVLIQWEVSHNSRYGQPGPLAYKLDTLIVNRKIEEALRPIPRIVRLGTLLEIAEQLDLGRDTNLVKKCLRQNAGALITAKFRYRGRDKSERTMEADFTRYAVVFTGEELPDGRKADAVYLVFNDVFINVINGAQTRPLDYDYLKDLPPASQRLYELLSFQIYAALKNGRKEARLNYAEFCIHAPLTRFAKWDQVRPQMARIHRPHLKSGYIESVKFEQTADLDGKPDWLVIYVPGARAKAEFRAFAKRGGPRTLEIELSSSASSLPIQPEEVTSLEQELINRGVASSTAGELLAQSSPEFVAFKIEHFDWLMVHRPATVEEPPGYLIDSIRKKYDPPAKFISKAAQELQAAKKKAKLDAEAKERFQQELRKKKFEAEKAAIEQYWQSLTPEEQQDFDKEAGIPTDKIHPNDYVTRFDRQIRRDNSIRIVLGLPPEGRPPEQGSDSRI